MQRILLGISVCLFGVGTLVTPANSTTESAVPKSRALIEAALKKIGGIEALEKAGGITWSAEGEYDLSARMQGRRADRPDMVPLGEKFGYIHSSGQTGYETHARVNPDADEWIRYVFDGEGRMQILDRLLGAAFWDVSPTVEDQRRRYLRIIPHLLLGEALQNKGDLQYAGEKILQNRSFQAVKFSPVAGASLTLLFDKASGDYGGLEYQIDYPLWGDTPVRWLFSNYQEIKGLGRYPTEYRILLGDDVLKTARLKGISTNTARAEVFVTPPGITAPAPPEIKSPAPTNAQAAAESESLPRVSQLADNVHLVVNVRSGFHVLVIQFKDFITLVDTPAGYHEFQQIPAIDWAGEKNSRAVGDRLLEAVRKAIPGKPVRYVVLTHHHSDHAGGIRPFIEAKATIVTSPETASVIRSSFGRNFSLESPEAPAFPRTDRFEIVKDQYTISDGETEARVINVGRNPHVEGMLVVFVPTARLLYQADLFEPSKKFPNPARVPIMKWFVSWLDDSGLRPEKIYAIHGAAKVSPEQIAKIRSSVDKES